MFELKLSNHTAALLSVLGMGIVAGCATTSSLTRTDVLGQYPEVARLDTGLADARARNAQLLAPTQYHKVDATLESAVELGRRADKVGAQRAAATGLEQLQVLNNLANQSFGVMEEVLGTRARAEEHGAASLFAEDFTNADKALRSAATLLEEGKQDEAAERRPELIRVYADLELRALQEGLVAAAEDAVARAKEADADDYAPKTLAQASQALNLARSVLEADRTEVDQSNAHAREAIWLARRAVQLTTMARMFEQADASREDILLWHQAQLQHVRAPANAARLPFDRANSEVVATLRTDITSLVQSTVDLRRANRLGQDRMEGLRTRRALEAETHREELRGLLVGYQAELAAIRGGTKSEIQRAEREAASQVADLQARLSDQARQREEDARREFEAQARFEHVRALFESREGDVYRKGEDVLIRLKGFQFRPGKSEIESTNFALLNNVVSAISIFPGGKVIVSGHTDSTGSTKTNLLLSQERAASVAEFLTTVGGVSAERLTSEGHGADEPVSSNETVEGRADNRRIDVSIVN